MKDFYSGIDLEMLGKDGQLKYSLIVQPGVDAIKLRLRILVNME